MIELTPKLWSWASSLETEARLQAERTSRLPVITGHVALMPDAHYGLGATVGSVIPTREAIIPAAVGVDIGCGMIAAETDLTADGLPDDLGRLHSYVARVVPAGVGKGHEREPVRSGDPPTYTGATKLTDKQRATLAAQFGTLGSGNHFVEVCLDERDRVWVVLHSGSRGIGNQFASAHIKVAKALHQGLEDPDLAYFTTGTAEFGDYVADMLWAQEYALQNRERMMDAVLLQLWGFVGTSAETNRHGVGREVSRINCHHNYSAIEWHGADPRSLKPTWITRKGAIRAQRGDLGVIPGSMGTSSYIVRGLGNPASYHSCAHGAGRRMSRGRAKRELTVESLREKMGDRAWNGAPGRAWSEADAKALLDEHPDAYKDIDQVMADQADLVEVVHTLRQVLNYKGT